jgi:hypothetical protein
LSNFFKSKAGWAVLLLFGSALSATATSPPSPESWFGHKIGAERKLLDWEKVTGYFQALAGSSDKIRVEEFGRSSEGRPMIVATIANSETLKNLDKYREIQRRLADPRLTTREQAEPLFAGGKNVVLITCSIHATEVASTHTAVEFAYRLITEQNPKFRAILDNDIVLLAPSINPDGVDIVTRWYRRTLGTAYEGTPPPELYQKYTGHDNNRDWYIFSQPETRAVIARLQNIWHPQIVYDVHQQGPYAARMFVPPWLDPIEPNVDPILAQEMNMIGASMASDLTSAGLKGISINSTYDFWTPSRHYQAFHGGLRILTESASARLATPIEVTSDQISREALGYDPRQRSWNHLEPWTGGKWTLRDIVDYQEAAFTSCLYQAAIHREDMLRAFYQIGVNSISRTNPAAFLIPARQRDPGAARRLLETLSFGMVEISRTSAGDHIISMRQPYSGYAKALLERQDYPDLREYPGGPPRRPYDVTAHTLPLLFGVDVRALEEMPKETLTPEPFEFGSSPRKAFDAADTDTWNTVNAVWARGGEIWRDPVSGDFANSAKPGWKRVPKPRIGLYHSFVPAMDEGWTRWLFDQFGFAYHAVKNPDLEAGDLRRSFDVIVFPDQPLRDLRQGYALGTIPADLTGGISLRGEEALKAFAHAGGRLVFLNRATEYATAELGLHTVSATSGLSNTQFYSPGSLLNVSVDQPSPLTLGLPLDFTVWSEGSPAWEVKTGSVLRYPAAKVLASGWLLGEPVLASKSALVDVKTGQGHVLLFGFRPQYRAQSYLTFKLLFNALIYD